jgi:hypothetical protein
MVDTRGSSASRLQDKAERRARAWLGRSGGLPWVTPAAWSLLVTRLQIRQAALRRVAGGLLGLWAAVWLVVAVVVRPGFSNLMARFAFGLSLLLVLSVAVGLASLLVVRSDPAKGATSEARMARGQTPRLRDVLGRWRCAVVAVTVAIDILFLAAMWLRYPGRDGLAVTTILVVGWVAVGLLIMVGLQRPTVAVDAASLAIDERLRSQDVAASLTLGYLANFLAVQLVEGVIVMPIACATVVAAITLNMAGTMPRRWRAPVPMRPRWFR